MDKSKKYGKEIVSLITESFDFELAKNMIHYLYYQTNDDIMMDDCEAWMDAEHVCIVCGEKMELHNVDGVEFYACENCKYGGE